MTIIGIRIENEPLYPSGKKYVAERVEPGRYHPCYLAAETWEVLVQRIRENQPHTEFEFKALE